MTSKSAKLHIYDEYFTVFTENFDIPFERIYFIFYRNI